MSTEQNQNEATVVGSGLNDGLGVTGSPLYLRQIAPSDDELMHKVWDGTPWMVDAYTGPISNYGRYAEIMDWCRDKFGPEAWPIHDKAGNWHSGGATVYGATWMGFATEEMMERFCEQWVTPNAPVRRPPESELKQGDDI
jgi:hypothetical protein